MPSFLENQLQAAKDGELTPTNTQPAVYMILAIMQLPVTLWVSWLLGVDGLMANNIFAGHTMYMYIPSRTQCGVDVAQAGCQGAHVARRYPS